MGTQDPHDHLVTAQAGQKADRFDCNTIRGRGGRGAGVTLARLPTVEIVVHVTYVNIECIQYICGTCTIHVNLENAWQEADAAVGERALVNPHPYTLHPKP